MNVDWLPRIEKALIGRECEIARREADWVVNVSGGASIALPIPWRIVAGGRIAFANEDDGQEFGLPAPLDGEVKANSLIASRRITGLRVDGETLDLAIRFEEAVRLDAFSNSSGYEGWHIHLPPEDGSLSVVALGGGEVAIF
jgi:hypothetical protein